MNSYLTENQFFAPISVIGELMKVNQLLLESCETYQKRGFRNKCVIDSPQGPLNLSVPLSKGKNEKMPIKEVRINYDTDWRRIHLQSIRSSYGSAPYFEYLIDDIVKIYQGKHKFIYDLNLIVWDWVIDFIELEISINQTTAYQAEITDPSIKDGRNQLKSNNYQLEPNPTRAYVQVFNESHDFIPNLSVLDLIFCTGKASLTYLS